MAFAGLASASAGWMPRGMHQHRRATGGRTQAGGIISPPAASFLGGFTREVRCCTRHSCSRL